MAPAVAFLTFTSWRESAVGLLPFESVQMSVQRTWDIHPVSSSGTSGGMTLGGGVQSESLGFVRWSLTDDTLNGKRCHKFRSQGYDKKLPMMAVEEIWATDGGTILRQRDEFTTMRGKRIGDATFAADHIDLTQTDERGRTTTTEVNPGGGMEAAQARFKPLKTDRKDFLALDAVNGSFHKVSVERTGHFKGVWGATSYEGTTYRYTVDGVEQTAMLTPENETVQVQFNGQTALVLDEAPPSHRKDGSGPKRTAPPRA